MDEVYRFDDASYTRLAAAGVTWQEVLDILHIPPRYRSHIGSTLRVAGQTREGRWVGVSLIEEGDDEYLVVGARELDPEEITFVRTTIEGGTP